MMICDDHQRRELVREHKGWNGLDYLEVLETTDPVTLEKRPLLKVYFLGKLGQTKIDKDNVRITGGRRITNIRVLEATPRASPEEDVDDTLEVVLEGEGDFSVYTLELFRVVLDQYKHSHDVPLEHFDPRYSALEFRFRPDCPADLDCATSTVCPPEVLEEPAINYLAKDYASFKQLIFDRLALVMPDWKERHVPDLGVALVELFAYVGDHLSYYQDAVATEAYLDTARQRISLRRHARLVDYAMHEGCNARAFVHLEVSQDWPGQNEAPLEPTRLSFITGLNDALGLIERTLEWDDLRGVPSERYEVFEPMRSGRELRFFQAHNEIHLHTWGERHCCLRKGATRATLRDGAMVPGTPEQPHPKQAQNAASNPEPAKREARELHLEVGDVLIFEEMIGPRTGNPADADPRHRHAVRLTKVTKGVDALLEQPVLEIEWCAVDALPFDLCLSGQSNDCVELSDISVARGNIVLVDHGRRWREGIGAVPSLNVLEPCDPCGCGGDVDRKPGRFRPHLERAPLTHAQAIESNFCASNVIVQDVRQALPQARLSSGPSAQWLEAHPDGGLGWTPQRDLLASAPDDHHFVAEIDNDGVAHLRFGDGELGARPQASDAFRALYRVGNGPRGNVGAEAISHLVLENQTVSGMTIRARNPLPATGGTAPETMDEVKLLAPFTFRERLERAITSDDYARIAERLFPNDIARAAASLRWTGSWHEVLVAIDAKGRTEAPPALLEKIELALERYRRIGHEVRVSAAQSVPLEVALEVCVLPHFVRGHVKLALLERFSSGLNPDGSRGFFDPDNLSFGEGISVSRIVATARMVPGIESVRLTVLGRYGQPDEGAVARGLLELGPLEVARLDNDPSQPELGALKLVMRGGR